MSFLARKTHWAFFAGGACPWVRVGAVVGAGGRGVVLVGLLGRSGSGACPNLPQRRFATGSAAGRSAEYQRFPLGAPARWGLCGRFGQTAPPRARGRGAADRVPFSRRVTPGRVGFFPARAAVLHIGEGRPRVQIPDFPRDSGTLPRTSVSGGRPPMCRTSPSAHGRISTVLNVGRFPHDSADPPTVDSGRMCNTASVSPIPHIRARCAGDSVRAETGRAGSGLRNASPAQRNPPHLAPCELSATKSACARSVRAHLARCEPR